MSERLRFYEHYEPIDATDELNFKVWKEEQDFKGRALNAFGKGARKEIIARDEGECQGITLLNGDCYWERVEGIEAPARFDNGYMITAAHYPDKHRHGEDDNPNRGRCLCTLCHALEELTRNNDWGARSLLQKNSILTWSREDETGEHIEMSFSQLKQLYEQFHEEWENRVLYAPAEEYP